MEFELGWSHGEILWILESFSEDFIKYQQSSYACELFNIAIYFSCLSQKVPNILIPSFLCFKIAMWCLSWVELFELSSRLFMLCVKI